MKEITIGTDFVKKAHELMTKLSKDRVFKERLFSHFKKDEGFIQESLELCENAQVAEDEYEKETKEAEAAKKTYEKTYNSAKFFYTKHTSLLKLLLKYEVKKQTVLGLTGREEPKSSPDWYTHAMSVYEKIIEDFDSVKLLRDYNITVPELQQGHKTILMANNANKNLAKESNEAKTAMFNKDFTFTELYDRMQIIQYCCYYIFLDSPKKFKALGLPIIDNEIGALINMAKSSGVPKDMVKDSSITKDMVKDSSITKRKK
jgi:hypothetical protein